MRFGSVTITNPMGMRQCDKTMGCGSVTTTDLIEMAVLPPLTLWECDSMTKLWDVAVLPLLT